jgi:polar amino acid transport system substrate-binding protein
MKRFAAVTLLATLGAAVLVAWGVAAPAGDAKAVARTAKAPAAPPLPAEVKARKRWIIGVKCDYPPFGYINYRGEKAGYDVDVARAFAELAFGKANRISMVCVTTPSRIPALQTKRVDIIISTLTFTYPRAETIDFSIPYYSATGRLLVPNNSSIGSVRDLVGKTVVTTRGALYATWIRNCFKDTKLLEVDSPSAAVLAVKDGRADTFMFDDGFLLGVAAVDPDLKLTNDKFLVGPWGIGIRKGDAATVRWVNWALRRMRAKDQFWKIFQANVPKRYAPTFADNVPRPNNILHYPAKDDDPLAKCP